MYGYVQPRRNATARGVAIRIDSSGSKYYRRAPTLPKRMNRPRSPTGVKERSEPVSSGRQRVRVATTETRFTVLCFPKPPRRRDCDFTHPDRAMTEAAGRGPLIRSATASLDALLDDQSH